MKRILLCFLLGGLIWDAQCADIVSIRPLTNAILMLHVDDGSILHHGIGQNAEQDMIWNMPLDITKAMTMTTYRLSSTTDAYYTTPRSPMDLGRKSKGTEFSAICQNWGFIPYFSDFGCINTDADHVKEHWIYLFLPQKMISGATYTLSTGDLLANGTDFTFTFLESESRSDAIHVNQIGYSSQAPAKFGYVYAWMGDKGGLDLLEYDGGPFQLVNTVNQQIAFTGQLKFRKPANSTETGQTNDTPQQNFLGADVYECDFSDFQVPGEYVLVVRDIGCSYPFTLGPDVFRNPFEAVMRGIYQNRSGIALDMPYAQERPAPHNVLSTPGFAGHLKYSATTWCEVSNSDASMDDKALWEAGIKGDLTQTWGWYQDAGDWDAYLRHLNVPSHLLFLFEQFPAHFNDAIVLPESGNGQPDILDEARWLLRFYKRLKDELLEKGWGTGGIGGSRIMGDLWGADAAPDDTGRGSWMDTTRTWVVSGEDTYASYWYAGAAAHYHFLLDKYGWADVESIDWLSEAMDAYQWAQNQEEEITTCHEFDLVHLRAYAAASLYKATADAGYEAQFLDDLGLLNLSASNDLLTGNKAFAAWQYASLPNGIPAQQQALDDAYAAIVATADFQLLFPALDNRACRWGGNFWFPMLVGQGTTPLIVEGVMAYALLRQSQPSKAEQYKAVIHHTADYFLGNNPLNMTWVTGLGEKSPSDIFHLDSWYSPSGGVRAGLVPYGPWQRQYFGPYGWWRSEWAALTTYPDYDLFPGHERWFSQRTAPLGAEFTIDQTNLPSAFIFGALMDSVNLFTSIKNLDSPNLQSLQVFPNPVAKTLQVILPAHANGQYFISNVTGQTMKSGFTPTGEIEVDSLSPGMYVLTIQTKNGGLIPVKFIVSTE